VIDELDLADHIVYVDKKGLVFQRSKRKTLAKSEIKLDNSYAQEVFLPTPFALMNKYFPI